MPKIKWGFIFGLAAFIFSFTIGLIVGVNILNVILRAVVLSIVFFGAGAGLRIVMDKFLPEVFAADDEASLNHDSSEFPGSRVDITLEQDGDYAVPEMYGNSSNQQELGNIEDLFPGSGGIDRNRENGYTNEGGGDQSGFESQEGNAHHARSGDASGLGGLPDLDDMTTVFSTEFGASFTPLDLGGGDSAQDPGGGKESPMKGDFDPKQLAEGIRTVLSRENK